MKPPPIRPDDSVSSVQLGGSWRTGPGSLPWTSRCSHCVRGHSVLLQKHHQSVRGTQSRHQADGQCSNQSRKWRSAEAGGSQQQVQWWGRSLNIWSCSASRDQQGSEISETFLLLMTVSRNQPPIKGHQRSGGRVLLTDDVTVWIQLVPPVGRRRRRNTRAP